MKNLKIGLLIVGYLFVFCGCSATSNQGANTQEKPIVQENSQGQDTVSSETTAMQLSENLGVGWNLGNTLDYYTLNPQENEGYMLMATYSSSPYTAWDQSEAISFQDGKVELSWNLDSLNSTEDSQIGEFSIQIINQLFQEDSDQNIIDYNVLDASYFSKDNQEFKLDTLIGEYSSVIKNTVTDRITADFSGHEEFLKTSDLLGGTLKITVEISSFPSKSSEGIDYETLWRNPKTTSEMIKTVKEAGFNSIRVPVTYRNHLDENYTIDTQWLDRVGEVVQYVLDENMYCIINLHNDVGSQGWIQANAQNIEENQKNLALLWHQIAEYFKDYSDYLIFEGFNEIADETGDFDSTNTSSYEAVNVLNQTFVDTIRETGGKNQTRFLVVNTYAAYSTKEVISAFTLPTDTIENHILVEVHCYAPENSLKTIFDRLSKTFVSKGIPVIIGEFGMVNTNDEEQRLQYVKTFVSEAQEKKLSYFWWDDGGSYENATLVKNFALLNRNTCTWYFPEVVSALIKS